MSTSVTASTSGDTSTRANDVCRRDCASNGEIRTRRWTPFSAENSPYAFSPRAMNVADLTPASSPSLASTVSTLNPRRSAQRRNIRSSISAQSCESVPPVPACTETTASPESYGPEKRRASSSSSRRDCTPARVSSSSPAIESSSAASSSSASRSSSSDSSLRNDSSLRFAAECSADTFAARSWSSQKPGSCISCSSAPTRPSRPAGSKVVREQLELVAEGRAVALRSSHGLCPVTLLELLAAPAPARVVAADLLFLVDVPRLHLDGQVEHLLLGVLDARRHHAGRRRGERARRPLGAAAGVLQPAGTGRLLLEAVRALVLDLHVVDVARELLPDRRHQRAEHLEALVLVRDQRVDLGEPAEVDPLAQIVHVVQVLAPAVVDDLQQDVALDLPHQLLAELLLALVVGLDRVVLELGLERLAVDRPRVDVLDRQRGRVDLLELGEEAVEVPVLDVVAREVLLDEPVDHVADLRARRA